MYRLYLALAMKNKRLNSKILGVNTLNFLIFSSTEEERYLKSRTKNTMFT